MNLFWLDTDPTIAAQAHHDVHVRKMLLEGVQLLCTAFEEPDLLVKAHKRGDSWLYCSPTDRLAADLLPYAHTHINHPCALWVRASRANFDRAIELAEALAAEFRYRFDKPHGSEAALDWVKRHRSEAQVPDGPLTPYALAMPEKYALAAGQQQWMVSVNDVIRPSLSMHTLAYAYRTYYRAEKRGHWRTKRAGLGRRALAAVGIGTATDRVWVPAKWTRRSPPEWFIL